MNGIWIAEAVAMNTQTAEDIEQVESALNRREPISVLRWVFLRKRQMLTCEIRVSGTQSYDVCVVPHWDIGASVIEAYDRPSRALHRHAELAWYLRESGWMRVCEAGDEYIAAA